MIIELMIENFAIIDKISVGFSGGLNIITGETGTGKSIVVDAINLLLGNRADKSLIRHGRERSLIEASFQLSEDMCSVKQMIEEYGIDLEEDLVLVVSREIHASGRNISRINGRVTNLGVLKRLMPNLLDIQGQNENQKLLRKDEQLTLLDSLGDSRVGALKGRIKSLYGELVKIERELSKADLDEVKREREMELLRYQIQEIDEADVRAGEEEALLADYKRLEKLGDIKKTMSKIDSVLNGDGYGEGLMSAIYGIGTDLSKISDCDEKIRGFEQEINSIYYSLEELSRSVAGYGLDMDCSQEDLLEMAGRIDAINGIKRKYGNTVEDIEGYRSQIRQELDYYENLDAEMERLNSRRREVLTDLTECSEELSSIRRELAEVLKRGIEEELKALNMKDSVFEVRLARREAPGETGLDDVEFAISTNIGQPLKPIVKVASGGEVSRLMLAFKNIVNEKDEVSTLIFDEIDAGISGRTAQLVGEKILAVSRKHQIICITHLPQIASMADRHFLITKSSSGEATTASIEALGEGEKVEEMSRLIGGVSVTDITREHAREMLQLSEKLKSECANSFEKRDCFG